MANRKRIRGTDEHGAHRRMRLAPLHAALEMLRARRLRTGLMVLQFAVGFAALVILMILVSGANSTVHRMEATFGSTSVLGLYPWSGRGPSGPGDPGIEITDRDLSALNDIPGVREVAVLWEFYSPLPDDPQPHVYAVNEAMERLLGLKVTERFFPEAPSHVMEAGAGMIFLTPAAREEYGLPDSMTYKVAGHSYTARVAGIATPHGAWPDSPPAWQFKDDPVALVMDYEAVRDWASLAGAVWLVLEEDADLTVVRNAVRAWNHMANPGTGRELEGALVAEEIASRAAFRQPGTLVASLLSVLFLLLAGLGFAGQAMLMADTRRSEWALRLALGATQRQVALQVLAELGAIVALAAVIGLAVVSLFVPVIASSAGYQQDGDWLHLALAAVVLAGGALSGLAVIYPLRRVSREEPSAVLKENW